MANADLIAHRHELPPWPGPVLERWIDDQPPMFRHCAAVGSSMKPDGLHVWSWARLTTSGTRRWVLGDDLEPSAIACPIPRIPRRSARLPLGRSGRSLPKPARQGAEWRASGGCWSMYRTMPWPDPAYLSWKHRCRGVPEVMAESTSLAAPCSWATLRRTSSLQLETKAG